MYINFAILKKYKLNLQQLMVIQICKQNKSSEDLSSELSKVEKDTINWLLANDYITTIQGNKNQSVHQKLRATKKGKAVLSDVETPEITEDDLTLFNWLQSVYETEDKLIGNKKKTKMYIAQFRVNSGIERNELAHLLEVFIEDEENMAYNMKLEFAFFKPSNVFQAKFDLDQSRLWQYYLKNKETIDAKYQERIRQLEEVA